LSLQGLSNAVENCGHLGSTTDERPSSLNLINVSPKESVGGSSPSGAATILNLKLAESGPSGGNLTIWSLPGLSNRIERPDHHEFRSLGSIRDDSTLYDTEGVGH